jgi:hypothetical protein
MNSSGAMPSSHDITIMEKMTGGRGEDQEHHSDRQERRRKGRVLRF